MNPRSNRGVEEELTGVDGGEVRGDADRGVGEAPVREGLRSGVVRRRRGARRRARCEFSTRGGEDGVGILCGK